MERVWLPGEQSHEKRIANARDGIPLPPQLRLIGVPMKARHPQFADEPGTITRDQLARYAKLIKDAGIKAD